MAAKEAAGESSNGTAETAKNTFHDYSSAVNSETEFGEAESNFGKCRVGGLGGKEISDEYSNGAAAEYGDSSPNTAGAVHDYSNAVNSETDFGTLSNDSSCVWVKSDAFEGYEEAYESVHKPVFPYFFELDLHEFCSTLTEHPIRKMVPVGPEYQADIPDWNPQSLSNYSSEQLAGGICIAPIPDIESSVSTSFIGVENEGGCYCLDKGSIRCVRQHVKESRAKLIENIGLKKFEELGFCDMGEVVAERWSDEEEIFFHDIVFSNKASFGKNYWHSLAISFPSRSNMELVSYYFNVFKLRQRAEQNRLIPTNIDSDNDEWQGFEHTEEDNGFAVESLDGQDTFVHDQATHEKDISGDTENGISEGAYQDHLDGINREKLKPKEGEGNFNDVSGMQVGEPRRDESCKRCECQVGSPTVQVDAETDARKLSPE
nr:AT-rich interactive domain-containing protein 1 [Ipomoea batatas]